MNATSSANGVGSSLKSSRGVSVVPRMVLPSQGTANNTRPSAVLGTSKAWSPGQNLRSTTRCTPWLGATSAGRFGADGSRSMSRTASTHTPVALMTQPACSTARSCVSLSRTVTPVTRALSRCNEIALQWFITTAPSRNAVRASASASRASSNWPSQ